MKIINETILDEFRTPGLCHICKQPMRQRDAHHHVRKGAGGGARLDVRINLVAVGATLGFPLCPCHSDCQEYRIPAKQVLEIIAAREHQTVEDVEAVLYLLARLDGKASAERLTEMVVKECGRESTRKLAFRELGEAGKVIQTAKLLPPKPWRD